MTIVAQPIAPPSAPSLLSLNLERWRAAHRQAVRHLIAASYNACGCTAQALCADGQTLEDRAEDAERVLGFALCSAVVEIADEIAEGVTL